MGTHGVVATVLDPHHGQIRCVRVETVELLRQGIGIAHPPDDQRRYLHPKRGGCGWGTNKQMDFRVSVLKVPDGDRTSVVVSTICTVHNLAGKLYLFSSFRSTGTAFGS